MLKVLLLRKKIDAAKKALEDLRAKDADFAKREAELEAAIEEAATAEGEDAAEAQKAVEEEVEKFDQEKADHEEAKKSLTDEITELENDLATEEASQETAPAQNPEPEKEERKVKTMSVTRNKFFAGKDVTAMFEREDVKAYLAEIRSCIKNKRELTNVGLTIPEVFVGLIKENVENYSKLYKHVNVQPIAGKAREIVQGTVAEAIWTECCAVLNELSLAFNDVEIDCYKVAGYYKVCNAVLEDNDVDLATKLLEALSQAIGLAVDKAILYGRNSASTQKMPLGIVSRLAQTSEPSNYPTTARPWVDLHTSNIISLSAGLTGAALFKQLVLASGKAKSNYSRGEKVWVMNETTYTKLVAETVSVDANGRVVTGVAGTMPVIGGVIEVLNFIPDNTIIGGYFDLYMLGERAGAQFAQSEHVFFIQDQTAFKGTARYDGQPVIAEAFVAIGLEATTPSANAVAFAPDEANTVKAIALNVNAVTIDLSEDDEFQMQAVTMPIDAPITWSSSAETYATVDQNGLITGKASGSATITAVSGSASASVAVTVTT
jgi:HK97 family phage major capsid protein